MKNDAANKIARTVENACNVDCRAIRPNQARQLPDCAFCRLCSAEQYRTGRARKCEGIVNYAYYQSEKWGGKYEFLCPAGCAFIAVLLRQNDEDGIAMLTGPFLMVELDDFGDCAINGANGTTFYFRVDWFTPDGLRTWGDGRTIIIGTKGYIEIRKYVDVGTERDGGNHVFLVNDQGEQYINATGLTGYPFFGDLILDSLNRTENAMTQAHAFKAAELCLIAQKQAEMVYQAK